MHFTTIKEMGKRKNFKIIPITHLLGIFLITFQILTHLIFTIILWSLPLQLLPFYNWEHGGIEKGSHRTKS